MMFSKKLWLRTKKNKHENSFRRKDVLLSKENLYWDDMHQRGYSDPESSCNHVNPTVEDDNTVWKVRGCQGESGQYLDPQCQALVMKETVLYGPGIKVRPLPPLPQATPTSSIYDYVEYPQKYRNIATNSSKRDAMICLVNEIEKSEELGRWKQFVEALERCGYEYISRCLKCRSVIDNSYQKKFLKIMSVAVRKQIVPTELTAYLWNADVINDEDKQRIECQQTLQGEIAAADLLLEILPTKKDNWYKLFIDALRHAEMIDVANVLDLPELREGKTGPKIISTRNDLEFSPANSMQEVTERIQCNPLNDGMIAKHLEHRTSSTSLYLVETNPDSDTTALKSTSPDDVNEQNTKMNNENKDSSNMNIMEKELYSWSSWASLKSVPDIPFFVVALHSRQKEREMELSISEGDCLKVVEDYGNFYGVQRGGKTWLIPKDSAKVFDKVPFPLPDETYTCCPPLPERDSPSLPERTPVDAFKINDTTNAATYSDDKRYEEVESPHLRVDAFKINDTTDTATDCIDIPYEEVESPDLRDTVDEEVCTQGSLNELLDCPPFVNAFKRTEDSRENNVRNSKCVQGGNFDHFEPESEYSSEGYYSAQHMLRNRTEKTSRDLPLQFEMYRACSTGRKSWRSRASSFKDSAIYECTNLAPVKEDT
ncbi:uncharacterized protein LOC128216777 [Mya arenaria]|uniref:uncharacterized protein LOC128216777 n=1 Tax=Mya arenaria TaxID=6604 RepID=UPI0022E3534C|nr:uncharacterized protein LOC128216777 [Mya arenaria]